MLNFRPKSGKEPKNPWTKSKFICFGKACRTNNLILKKKIFFSYSAAAAASSIRSPEASSQQAPRMWTCTKCSYAYNPIWVDNCDICTLRRTPPSLTQPSLITLTKDKPTATIVLDPRSDDQSHVSINNKTETVKFSRQLNDNNVVEVPIATFEQDLEDDNLDDTVDYPQEWTCKKCTLVNSVQAVTCIVCGGSKLKSVSTFEELTLRKGEFWVCTHCTLKNSLSITICGACKSVKQISGQQTNYRPYTSTPASNLNNKNRPNAITTSSTSTPQTVQGGLTPPVHRVLRSPSPKYDRSTSGAIPKVNKILMRFAHFHFHLFSIFHFNRDTARVL